MKRIHTDPTRVIYNIDGELFEFASHEEATTYMQSLKSVSFYNVVRERSQEPDTVQKAAERGYRGE